MTYQDRILASTFLGVSCQLIGFLGIVEMAERQLADRVGIVLASVLILSLTIGVALYRRRESPWIGDAWPLVVVGMPSVLLAFFSYTFARESRGMLWHAH